MRGSFIDDSTAGIKTTFLEDVPEKFSVIDKNEIHWHFICIKINCEAVEHGRNIVINFLSIQSTSHMNDDDYNEK